MTVLKDLDRACAAEGTILFTVTAHDLAAGLFRRIYSNTPAEYPVQGTKPLTRDAWYDLVIRDRQPFVANTPDAFRELFFDHAQIEALGLGSAANLPVVDKAGDVVGTVNLLAGPGHFTAERLAIYQAEVQAVLPALVQALRL
ncbi:MAG: GAF domain-containing protein [Paracoccaceae bacterium]